MSEKIPENWTLTELSNIVIYKKGKKPKKLINEKKDGYIPYVNIKAFEQKIIDEYADMESSNLIDESDILVVWDGARFGLSGTGMVGAAGSTLMVLKPLICYPRFVHAFINRYYRYINSKPKGSGTPHVNPDIFWNLPFPLPPLYEQKRIVAKLDAIIPRIDSVKERLEKIPVILKRFRQSVLTAAVTGKLTEKWREEHPETEGAEVFLDNVIKERIKRYKEELEEAKISKLRNPKCNILSKKIQSSAVSLTWINIEIQQLFCVETGATPLKTDTSFYYNGTIPWIKSGDIQNCDITECTGRITEKALKNTNVKYYPENTLLIAMYGEGKTRGQIGKIKFRATSNQACAALINQHLNETTVNYTFLFGLSQYEQIRMEAAGGNQPNLNLTKIKKWIIPLPPLEEQKEIVRQVDKLFALADKVEVHYRQAKEQVDKLSQSVLAKAFRGELVPQDPTDEPAEKLLERILEEKAKMEATLKKAKKKSTGKRTKKKGKQ
ncbi:MAG TPA: restriction endonuclease subunit S [Thermotogota bacterium]|nr:restriction endonuclease subunit S [Thermotogota bacterium]